MISENRLGRYWAANYRGETLTLETLLRRLADFMVTQRHTLCHSSALGDTKNE